jgi:hypothetical protein
MGFGGEGAFACAALHPSGSLWLATFLQSVRGAVTGTVLWGEGVGLGWFGRDWGFRGVSGGMRSGDGCFPGDIVRWNVALCGTRSGAGFWCDSWLGMRELGCKQDACTTLLSCRAWQRHRHLELWNPG